MTYGEIYKEFCDKCEIKAKVDDWRPCIRAFFSDVDIPYAIIIWLKDGSKIMYQSEKAKKEDKEKEQK